jgi:hypothetical protein
VNALRDRLVIGQVIYNGQPWDVGRHRAAWTITGAPGAPRAGKWGQRADLRTDDDGFHRTLATTERPKCWPVSLMVAWYQAGTPTSVHPIWRVRNPASPFSTFGVLASNSTLKYSAGFAHGTGTSESLGGATGDHNDLTVGYHVAVVVIERTRQTMWMDGRHSATEAVALDHRVFYSASPAIETSMAFTVNTGNMDFIAACVWARKLTVAEVFEVMRDPRAPFRPTRQRVSTTPPAEPDDVLFYRRAA